MSADSKCPISGDSQDLIVTRGKLANVFVYLKGKSIDGYAFETPGTPAILDQGGCQFAPRVLGIQVGQVLKVLNSDITTHNVHPVPRLNAEWNTSAPPGEALEKPFKRAEVLIPIKCNQHPWMKAWVGVLEHPFFAVSDFDGSYKMSAIPPGEYQVVAWHEKLGEQTATVSIGNHEMKTINFRFRRQSASGNRVHTSGRRP